MCFCCLRWQLTTKEEKRCSFKSVIRARSLSFALRILLENCRGQRPHELPCWRRLSSRDVIFVIIVSQKKNEIGPSREMTSKCLLLKTKDSCIVPANVQYDKNVVFQNYFFLTFGVNIVWIPYALFKKLKLKYTKIHFAFALYV